MNRVSTVAQLREALASFPDDLPFEIDLCFRNGQRKALFLTSVDQIYKLVADKETSVQIDLIERPD
jgi:hypothetical protein